MNLHTSSTEINKYIYIFNIYNYQYLSLAHFPLHICFREELFVGRNKPNLAYPLRNANMPYYYNTKQPKILHMTCKSYNTSTFQKNQKIILFYLKYSTPFV